MSDWPQLDLILAAPADNHEQGPPLEISFERAQRQLEQLPRLWFEPDGAFFWNGNQRGTAWQLAGTLTDDAHGQLRWCRLTGSCPHDCWLQLLQCFDWPTQPMWAYLVRESSSGPVERLGSWWDHEQ